MPRHSSEEARRLRRRRWIVGLLVVAVVVAGIGWALAGDAHRDRPPRRRRRPGTTVIRATSGPGCPKVPTPTSRWPARSPSHPAVPSTSPMSTASRYWYAFRRPLSCDRRRAGRRVSRVTAARPSMRSSWTSWTWRSGPTGACTSSTETGSGWSSPQRRDLDRGRNPRHAHFSAVLLGHHSSAADRQRHAGPLGIDRPTQLGGHRRERTGCRCTSRPGCSSSVWTPARSTSSPPERSVPPTTASRCPIWDRSRSTRRATSIVSGGNGWAIWQVAPNGVATEVGAPNARRSGGNTSVLERAPDGVVYGESGPTFLKLQGGRADPRLLLPPDGPRVLLAHLLRLRTATARSTPTRFPGFGAWEKYQQLRVVRDNRSSVLWQQTSATVAPTTS